MYDHLIKLLEDLRLCLWWKLHGTWIETLIRRIQFRLPWLFVVTGLFVMIIGPYLVGGWILYKLSSVCHF